MHIRVAAALDRLGRWGKAMDELKTALELALPDDIVMPFAENCSYITALLQELQKRGAFPEQIEGILILAEQYRESKQRIFTRPLGRVRTTDSADGNWKSPGLRRSA